MSSSSTHCAFAVPADPELDEALAQDAHCLYARRAPAGPFAALPRVSDFRPDLLPILAAEARRTGAVAVVT